MNDSPLAPFTAVADGTFAQFLDAEETLVEDTRSGRSPCQQVEQKLIDRLKNTPVMVSQIQRRLKPDMR